MTDEQINEAVAIELGWTCIRDELFTWKPSQSGIAPGDSESSRREVPDFCEDYNAAAEMLKTIDPINHHELFLGHLDDVLIRETHLMPSGWGYLRATPHQQAEAFLRMCGKWSSQSRHSPNKTFTLRMYGKWVE